MKVTGSASIAAPRDEVWKALNDPAVLVRTIPGVSRLEEIDTDVYRMTIYAGVASIKGTYQGEVRLAEQQQPDSFVLRATGTGAPGTVNADVAVRLTQEDASTRIDYDADAVVGGMIGGVGQRVLGGVAKKTAGNSSPRWRTTSPVLCQRRSRPPPACFGRSRRCRPARIRGTRISSRSRCVCARGGRARRSGRGGHRPARARSWAAGSPVGGDGDARVHRGRAAGSAARGGAEPRDDRRQRLVRRRLGAAMRGGIRRRADRAAGNGDHRVLPGLLGEEPGDLATPDQTVEPFRRVRAKSAFTWSGGRTPRDRSAVSSTTRR